MKYMSSYNPIGKFTDTVIEFPGRVVITDKEKYALICEVLNTAKSVDEMAKEQGIKEIRIVKEEPHDNRRIERTY